MQTTTQAHVELLDELACCLLEVQILSGNIFAKSHPEEFKRNTKEYFSSKKPEELRNTIDQTRRKMKILKCLTPEEISALKPERRR